MNQFLEKEEKNFGRSCVETYRVLGNFLLGYQAVDLI